MIAWIISKKHTGGLSDSLWNENLVFDIDASVDDYSYEHHMLSIEATLTDEGYRNFFEIK